MRQDDIPTVTAISDAVHGAFTEDAAVFAERLALYPAGCFMLERGDLAVGYLIAHPWHRDDPPLLNGLLGALPADPGTFYLHDIALLPAARGMGSGTSALRLADRLAADAGLPDITLIAVNGADSFWHLCGFSVEAPAAYGPGTFLMRRTAGGGSTGKGGGGKGSLWQEARLPQRGAEP